MINIIKNIINEIYWAYQRVRYGYDSRIKWEFDSYFSQFIKPLKEFCQEELKEKHIIHNHLRKEVFTHTLKLIKDYENRPNNDCKDCVIQNDNSESELWKYVGRNISFYWN